MIDLDLIKSASIGTCGFAVQCMEAIPEVVRVLAGVATIVYFVYKIRLIKRELR